MKNLLAFILVCISIPVLSLAKTTSKTQKMNSIDEIKSQIVSVAIENINRTDNLPEVRQQLEALVSELRLQSGPVTDENIRQYLAGGWQQIWADEANNDPAGAPAKVMTEIFQVIDPSGWGFNFGTRQFPNGTRGIFALEVEALIQGTQQTTQITKAYFRSSEYSQNESLIELAQQIRSRDPNSKFSERSVGRFPNGPIGAEGVLTLLYLDQDLKIGRAPNVYTGVSEFFVLRRRTNY